MKGLDSRVGILMLLCVLLLASAGNALAEKANPKEDCNCNKSEMAAPEDKLIDSEKLFSDIEQGGEKIKVIISLKKPDRLKRVMDWHSKSTVNELQGQVKSRQNLVLKSLSKKEFKLRHQFKYQAAFSAEITPDCLNKLLDNSDVVSIEPIYTFHLDTAQGIPLMNGMQYRSTYNGHGVAIAICDTGIDYNHPRLGGGGFPNGKVIGGYDFGNNDNDPMPVGPTARQAHGTACAGIAAGDIGTVGDYIGGVAYGAKIYALKVTEDGNDLVYSDKVIAAWEWCIAHQYDDPQNPILVISNSFGDGKFTSPCDGAGLLADAAAHAVQAGITVLAASGNDGYCNSVKSPACISNVISVGAVYDAAFGIRMSCIALESCVENSCVCPPGYHCAADETAADKVASYSNTASFLDVLAPANNAYTTDITGVGGYADGDYYSSFSGTSAACPYAAGAAAALQSASKAIKRKFLTPAEVKNVLTLTGDLITDNKASITKPRINLVNAIMDLGTNLCGTPLIGTGTSGWTFPMHTYYQDSRTQVIYLASEIGRPGFITNLALDVNVAPGQVMKNWTIRMKHTTLNAYSSCALEADGWTVVYQANEPAGTTGWRTFPFTTAFEYDGVSNLMIDFSHNNTSYTTNGHCKSSTPGRNRSVVAYSDGLYGDPLNWEGMTSPATVCDVNVPNIRLTICDMAGPNSPTMIAAEPNITDGNCIDVFWGYVADANEYFAQCAADSYFASVVSDSNWISGLEYQFCEYGSHRYFYRVKARNMLNIEGGWSNVISSRQCDSIQGDFDDDCDVDMKDLKVLADQWLYSESPGVLSADIAPLPESDGMVNFLDFAVFASHWLEGAGD